MTTWKDGVLRVTPYVPGEQPAGEDLIKLNTNENPYPPAPGVQEILRNLDADDLRRYPDPNATRLVDALSERYRVPADQIFVGVGSDDVLALSFLTFFSGDNGDGSECHLGKQVTFRTVPIVTSASREPLIFPDITYSFYKVWAALYGIRYREIPLNNNYTLDEEEHNDFRADYLSGTARGIVIANPNAPTGIAAPLALIEEIVKSNPQCVVIVDEAYIDFGGESALPLTDKYDNLLVVQTFSKSRSMAGMRIGYAFGAKELIRALNDVKFSVNSYTLNIPSILAGEAALKDEAYFQECVKRIKATREDVRNKLDAMGFTTLPSATNFLFTRPAGNNAEEIYNRLRDARIYVRYFNAPRTKDFLRITIGTEEEMKRLLDNLKSMI